MRSLELSLPSHSVLVLPCSALLVAGVVYCFVFRPGHELCRVMSALLRAWQCCVLRPVVLPVALVGGVTYCPAVS